MDLLAKSVDSLYDYRNNFFSLHKICEASEKPWFLKEKLNKVLEDFENADASLKSKAEYFMLKGKALNVVEDYDLKAEDLLAKAVKLDPMLSEAWTCLGDCYWKNNKYEAAKDCFVSSISHKKNKEALRNLSTITRSMSREKKLVEDSVQMAKEALQMDLSDGLSWLTLGNAYIDKYFSSSQDPVTINQALSAYKRAEQDPTTKHNYTLFYNKATAHEFLENFEEALSCYYSCNQHNPTFSQAQQKEASLLKYLREVTLLVRNKGKIRDKRLKMLVNKINPTLDIGKFAPTFMKDSTDAYKNINQLCEGTNAKCLLVGRVVGSLFSEGRVSQTFFIVDVNSECSVVSLYNVAQQWCVCVGDSIVINEPTFKNVSFQIPASQFPSPNHQNNTQTNNSTLNTQSDISSNTIIFPLISINHPSHLLINSRKPPDTSISPPTLSLKMLSE